jgi:YaiO family outer membrane protein
MRNTATLSFIIGLLTSSSVLAQTTSADLSYPPQAPSPVPQINSVVPTAPFPQSVPTAPPALAPRRGVDILTQEQWEAAQKSRQNRISSNEPAAVTLAEVHGNEFKPTGYVEAGGDYHWLTNHFGSWSGTYVKGEVQTDPSNRWSAEEINQREFGSGGVYGDIGNTHVFNDDWYSSVTVGGGGIATFLPRLRTDGFINRKWLEQRQLVTTFGLGADKFQDGHRDASAYLGATYYIDAFWNAQGGVRFNNSNPGGVHSASAFVAVTEGSAQHHFITLRYGFGKEAYQILSAGNSISDFNSQQVSLELRQWLGEKWGFDVRGEEYHNPNYNRIGLNLGVFKEF